MAQYEQPSLESEGSASSPYSCNGQASRIERDCDAAIERLRQGIPQHPDLKEKVAAGKPCKINVSNVAKEAGHSRNTLYERYPEVLKKINDATSLSNQPGNVITPQGRITELRQTKAQLEQEKRDALTENLGLLVRFNNLKERNEHLKDEVDRLKRQLNKINDLRQINENNN